MAISLPSFAARDRLAAWIRVLIDWRPVVAPLPRSECHYLEIELRGVAARALERAVSLQLLQLTGLARAGFVYRPRGGKIAVWYWDEAALSPERIPGVTAAQTRNGIAPWPETILARLPERGLHLMRRSRGYEALAMENGEIRRTRWFAELPDARKWSGFARDAGYSLESDDAVPPPQTPALDRKTPKGWKLSSHFLARVPLTALGIAAFVALLGAALTAMTVYEIKLEWAIYAENTEVERIARENAVAFDLQKKIAARTVFLDRLGRIQPEVPQLDLMRALAESGLVATGEQPVSLLEWEYRGRQLRLLFAVPPKLALVDFLARLEALPMMKNIRLLPDTPPQTVGVQATLLPWRYDSPPADEKAAADEKKAETAPAAAVEPASVPGGAKSAESVERAP